MTVAIMVAGAVASATIAFMLTADRMPVPGRSVRQDSPPMMDRTALDRCRTISMPDSGCDAAWAMERRRFFQGARP